MIVLALNAGSSSLKASLYEMVRPGEDGTSPPRPLWEQERKADESVDDLANSVKERLRSCR